MSLSKIEVLLLSRGFKRGYENSNGKVYTGENMTVEFAESWIVYAIINEMNVDSKEVTFRELNELI